MFGPGVLKRETHLWPALIGFLFVAGVVLLIYFPTLSFEFTNWDDPSFVQNNQSIQTPGWAGLKKVFTRTIPDGFGDYMPVTILSYWVDYQLWGFQPKGYHLTNLLLHALSTGLMFLLFSRLTARPVISIIATLLFAVHPMNTEAVTWIAGRKSVMALLWMLLSFHAFLNWQRNSAVQRKYLYLSLLCYVLACLSKTAVVFFPMLLLACQICLKKIDIKRSLTTTSSFFVISIIIGLCRFFGHYTSGQMALKPFDSLWVQLFTVFEIFGFYFQKLIIPVNLNNNYPLEVASTIFEPGVLFGILSMLAMIIVIVKCMRNYPMVSFGLIWYLIAWLPHSQIIVIPPALRADRYMYYSSAGLFLAIVCGIGQWTVNRKGMLELTRLRIGTCAIGLLVIAIFTSMTTLRNNVWADSISLWRDSVQKGCQNPLAHTNLGKAYEEKGMLDEAMSEHNKVLAINPAIAVAHYNLGSVYAKQGRLDEAITAYKRSLAIDPYYPEVHTDLGNAYYKQGRLTEAIREHKQALVLDDGYYKAYLNLGVAYGAEGSLDKAIIAFKKACSINPYFADAHNNLSVAYYYAGDYALAIKHYTQAQNLGYGVNQKLLELLKPHLESSSSI